jgi:hypothetical protein
MKKILLSFGFLGLIASANAQNVVNGNFEATATELLPGIATDCPGWGQGLYTMEITAPFAGMQSAKLRSIVDPMVAGVIGSLSDSIPGLLQQEINGSFTNAGSQPLMFTEKHVVVMGDTSVVFAQFSDTMGAGPNDDVVMFQAYGMYAGTSNTWTTVSIPFQQFGMGTANRLTIIACTSTAYLFGGGPALPGTQLWLDNVSIGATSSITELKTEINVYPNPSSDIVNFEASEAISSVVLVGMDGKFAASTTESSMNISTLPNGIYFYTLTTVSGQKLTGKVTKI